MVKFPSAAKGLKWMFWGETLSIVCVLVGIIPLMGTPSAVGQFVCGLLILAGAFVANRFLNVNIIVIILVCATFGVLDLMRRQRSAKGAA